MSFGPWPVQDAISYMPEGAPILVDALPADGDVADRQDADDLVRQVLGHDPWHRDAGQAGQACLGPVGWEVVSRIAVDLASGAFGPRPAVLPRRGVGMGGGSPQVDLPRSQGISGGQRTWKQEIDEMNALLAECDAHNPCLRQQNQNFDSLSAGTRDQDWPELPEDDDEDDNHGLFYTSLGLVLNHCAHRTPYLVSPCRSQRGDSVGCGEGHRSWEV